MLSLITIKRVHSGSGFSKLQTAASPAPEFRQQTAAEPRAPERDYSVQLPTATCDSNMLQNIQTALHGAIQTAYGSLMTSPLSDGTFTKDINLNVHLHMHSSPAIDLTQEEAQPNSCSAQSSGHDVTKVSASGQSGGNGSLVSRTNHRDSQQMKIMLLVIVPHGTRLTAMSEKSRN